MINLYIINESGRATFYGIGTYVRELTASLADNDINISVIYLHSDHPEKEPEEINGIRNLHIPSPIIYHTTLEQNIQEEMYYRNVLYILHLHLIDTENLVFHMNSSRSSPLVDMIRQAFECKIITIVHYSSWGFSVFDNLQRLRTILKNNQLNSFDHDVKRKVDEERTFYTKADHIVCLSSYMHEILINDYGLDTTKLSVIPNGLLDVTKVTDDENNVKILRKKWKISPRAKILLFAGRIDEIKGVSYLIKAFREVLKKIPDCRLMIVGSGNYDTYFQEAKNICTKITFPGLLKKKELYELYQIADIGVVPSLYEPFGYVAVEMMMHGLPVVATVTSGLNEVVDDTCGLKVPLTELPDKVEIDTTLLAEKMLYLLEHLEEAKKMGQNGRKRYLKKYSSVVFGKNMMGLYQKVLNDEQ